MDADVIRLNVGGELYWTTRTTIQKHPSSELAKMLSGETPASWSGDCLCVDRDGRLFRHVLNYLRDGRLPLGLSHADRTLLLQEVKYFGLDELHQSLGGLQEPQPRPSNRTSTGLSLQPDADSLIHEVKTSRQFVRLRWGHEYSGGWLVSSPRNLAGVDYELHAACLARSPLEALNKLSKAGFLPCSRPPKMMYKDHPVPLVAQAPKRTAPQPVRL
ncbi:unnamed protein product [Durusdinium trenchii]|uniref:Potassium channel tetramerisation-type BTB domain-containing protein n=1 Tax=Durusdinium trenchii TaxID=1381693 RepID=A0ABP0MGF2_9DINO